MTITAQDIKHLADLARIEMSESEAEKMVPEIDSILGYVGQINAVDISAEKIMPKLRNVMREDIPTNEPMQYTDALLDNAPARDGNYLKVKKIL